MTCFVNSFNFCAYVTCYHIIGICDHNCNNKCFVVVSYEMILANCNLCIMVFWSFDNPCN